MMHAALRSQVFTLCSLAVCVTLMAEHPAATANTSKGDAHKGKSKGKEEFIQYMMSLKGKGKAKGKETKGHLNLTKPDGPAGTPLVAAPADDKQPAPHAPADKGNFKGKSKGKGKKGKPDAPTPPMTAVSDDNEPPHGKGKQGTKDKGKNGKGKGKSTSKGEQGEGSTSATPSNQSSPSPTVNSPPTEIATPTPTQLQFEQDPVLISRAF